MFLRSCFKSGFNAGRSSHWSLGSIRSVHDRTGGNDQLSRELDYEAKYLAQTGLSFSNYHNWYGDDIASGATKNFIQMMKSQYFSKIKKNNYFEIGVGKGTVAQEFGPYFSNIVLLEPNKLFSSETIDALKRKSGTADNVHLIEKFVDDFDVNVDLPDSSMKFDLINMQDVFWHVELSQWDNVLNKLYQVLNVNENGILNITQMPARGALYEIHKHFVPMMRSTQYFVDYFQRLIKENDESKMVIKQIDDPLTMVLPESECLELVADMLKADLSVYDSVYPNNHACQETAYQTISEFLKQDNCYSKQDLVTLVIEQEHVLMYNTK